ncbi:MAG: ABC transporter ATP-binding protein [Acutalibacteraceae bacterium]|nr:ABC transporter ATP-binding protein [Acutalibacteraceae bacterium]
MTQEKPKFDQDKILREEQTILNCYSGKKRGTVATLFRFYKGNYKNLGIAALMFLVKSSPTWIIPLITAAVIDIATQRPADALRQFVIYGAVTVLILLQNIPTHTIYMMFLSRAQRSVEAGLRGAMIRKLQQLSITFHKEIESGKIQSKVMRDVEAIENFTSQIFTTAITVIVNMTISLVIVINKNIAVFFMFLVCIPFTVLLSNVFKKKMRKLSHNFRKEIENTASDVLDMEELIPVTRAHALENHEVKKLTSSVARIAESGYKMDKIYALFGSVNWVMFSLFQMICLFFTGILAYRGKITIGDVTLYQSYFNSLIAQVSSIIGLLPIIAKGTESISSIGEILSSDDVENNKDKIKIESLKGEYEFKNVCFKYDDKTPVLNDFSLTVKAGETVALVGESGAGKSTVLNLVIGFNKLDSGSFKIDGTDAEKIDMRSYRRFISMVPQTSILFSGTIRENVTYGRRHVTDELLNYAVKAARLESVIEKLPDGLDTKVGEHGAKLSGGQRQRISIARAIIRNPRVIIFDEATSALDSVTESEIQKAIENLTENRTTFIVAHRLSTIKNADKIAVVDNGRCVEYGTYDELMAKKGHFYKLKQMQS